MMSTEKLEWNKRYLQLAELLAELPGIWVDLADGILAEIKLLQHQQAIQPSFGYFCQIVKIQLSEIKLGRNKY